jgi:hypothetical protein
MEVRVADDLEGAFETAANARVGALTLTPDPTGLFNANQQRIFALAVKKRLPAMYTFTEWVNAGGLMS